MSVGSHIILSIIQTMPQFEISIPHIAYAALGGFVVLVSSPPSDVDYIVSLALQFGMFSLFIREKVCLSSCPHHLSLFSAAFV